MTTPPAIIWQNQQLQLLDQRKLPTACDYISYCDADSVAAAIRDMVVRGAPAIGITAAYAMALAALSTGSSDNWQASLTAARAALAASRPTAVNLFWALTACDELIEKHPSDPALPQLLLQLAGDIHNQDISNNHAIGDFGASHIAANSLVYTHCNAGALATGGYGTALGVIRSAYRDGKICGVIAGETRPWLQGARLTCWELQQDGIPVTLATEGAAAHVMRDRQPSWIIVGADRIAANGDVANKIGTYNLAIIAKHHGVKVMVAAPTSTFDADIDGTDIPIEQRPSEEITDSFGQRIAALNIDVANPAFDVTPAELIDVIVTERGSILAPNRESVAAHLASK
ncbi:MAG: S-methyl-5-thioribose-1-phosphate isomerase [Spongiibacteraceae bacterium]